MQRCSKLGRSRSYRSRDDCRPALDSTTLSCRGKPLSIEMRLQPILETNERENRQTTCRNHIILLCPLSRNVRQCHDNIINMSRNYVITTGNERIEHFNMTRPNDTIFQPLLIFARTFQNIPKMTYTILYSRSNLGWPSQRRMRFIQ